jgi:hypothetical protein
VEVTVATMTSVDPGSYAVFGKTTVEKLSGSNGQGPSISCTLDAGGASTDQAQTEGRVGGTTLPTQVLTTFAGTGTITLRCVRDSGNGTYVARQTKIIAVRIDSVTRQTVSG